jgi:hypothetical protein
MKITRGKIGLFSVVCLPFCGALLASGASFIGSMNMIKAHASTVPGNGDVNPYGVAVIPQTVGSLKQGNILVSNFNNSANLQGTGTTIVQSVSGRHLREVVRSDQSEPASGSMSGRSGPDHRYGPNLRMGHRRELAHS